MPLAQRAVLGGFRLTWSPWAAITMVSGHICPLLPGRRVCSGFSLRGFLLDALPCSLGKGDWPCPGGLEGVHYPAVLLLPRLLGMKWGSHSTPASLGSGGSAWARGCACHILLCNAGSRGHPKSRARPVLSSRPRPRERAAGLAIPQHPPTLSSSPVSRGSREARSLGCLEALHSWPAVGSHPEHWGSNSQSHVPLPTVRIAERIQPGTWCPELLRGTEIKPVVVVSGRIIVKQIHLSLVRDGGGLR